MLPAKEYKRAFLIRRKLRDGFPIEAADREWLRAYETRTRPMQGHGEYRGMANGPATGNGGSAAPAALPPHIEDTVMGEVGAANPGSSGGEPSSASAEGSPSDGESAGDAASPPPPPSPPGPPPIPGMAGAKASADSTKSQDEKRAENAKVFASLMAGAVDSYCDWAKQSSHLMAEHGWVSLSDSAIDNIVRPACIYVASDIATQMIHRGADPKRFAYAIAAAPAAEFGAFWWMVLRKPKSRAEREEAPPPSPKPTEAPPAPAANGEAPQKTADGDLALMSGLFVPHGKGN